MKKTIALLSLVLAANVAVAAPKISKEHQVGSITTEEITASGFAKSSFVDEDITNPLDPIERIGKIIAVGKELVALGEEVYTLVQKGKPSIQTEYAPVSVVPKDPSTREPIDPFELEGFSVPVVREFKTTIKNMIGLEVINFKYKVIYSYGGSYNGVGKYLTGVQVVPTSVSAKYGWDVKATMKVQQVLNHGTKANPIAGLIVSLNYTMNSWGRAEERNDTLHIAGNGGMKSMGLK